MLRGRHTHSIHCVVAWSHQGLVGQRHTLCILRHHAYVLRPCGHKAVCKALHQQALAWRWLRRNFYSSYTPWQRRRSEAPRLSILGVHETDQIGVRMGNWKLVVEKGQPHLFNLVTDLHEDHDVASSHFDILSKMLEVIKKEHTPSADFVVTLPSY